MPDSAPDIPTPELHCGNCGAPVTAAAVTCPVCGVLLAAYQAPAGSSSADTISGPAYMPAEDSSATHETPAASMSAETSASASAPPPAPTRTPSPFSSPSATTPAFSPPSPAAPRSQSPIDDALRDASDDSPLIEPPSDMAKAIDAELAGARVTFDGAKPVIASDQVEITSSGEVTPARTREASPAQRLPPATAPLAQSSRPAPATTQRPAPRPVQRPSAPVMDNDQTVPSPVDRPPPVTSGPDSPSRSPGRSWAPFVVVGIVILIFSRSISGSGAVVALIFVVGVIFILLRISGITSRKTTTMRRDDSWKRPPRR